jgi:Flp pilus assembly protein TadD
VAWIAERKNVLSTFFFLLTIWSYIRYLEQKKRFRYLLVLTTFALGLMAKPMLVTLPFLLLLLDYWPFNRFNRTKNIKNHSNNKHIFRQLIKEKIPFFLLTVLSSIITFLVQQSGGTIKKLIDIPLSIRIINIPSSYLKYIEKMIWPSKLAVLYPYPINSLSQGYVFLAIILILGISAFTIYKYRTLKYLFTGWFWYLGTMVPVIGLVQVGNQGYADRYTYLPLIGLFIIIAWGFGDLVTKRKNIKLLTIIFSISTILTLSICTHVNLKNWRNSMTLFKHAVEVTENNSTMHYNLGLALQFEGKLKNSIDHFYRALEIRPNYMDAHYNMAVSLQRQGNIDSAIKHYLKVLQLKPDDAVTMYNVAIAYHIQNNLEKAIQYYRRALLINQDYTKAHYNLGIAFSIQGKTDQAINQYRQTLRIDPRHIKARFNLANTLSARSQWDEAIGNYRQILKFKPDYVEAYGNLGNALSAIGKHYEAIEQYRKALDISPDNDMIKKNLVLELQLTNQFGEK